MDKVIRRLHRRGKAVRLQTVVEAYRLEQGIHLVHPEQQGIRLEGPEQLGTLLGLGNPLVLPLGVVVVGIRLVEDNLLLGDNLGSSYLSVEICLNKRYVGTEYLYCRYCEL